MNNSIDFPHHSQKKAYTCGPTAIKIICDFLKYPNNITDDYIEKISGTNTVYGCTDVNMSRGLNTLGIQYKRIVDYPKELAMMNLIESLKSGNKIILRTLTKNIKHWIVVYDYKNDKFLCSDPWLGKITYSYDEIISIWEPRNFDAFIILDRGNKRPIIDKISESDKNRIVDMVANEFTNVMSESASYAYLNGSVNWDMSVKLTIDDKIIGCYLLAERNFNRKELEGKHGIEGVALVVKNEYREFGYGKMLISYTENLPYDYIWGQHLKGLKNIDNWTRRRDYSFDYGNSYITLKML